MTQIKNQVDTAIEDIMLSYDRANKGYTTEDIEKIIEELQDSSRKNAKRNNAFIKEVGYVMRKFGKFERARVIEVLHGLTGKSQAYLIQIINTNN